MAFRDVRINGVLLERHNRAVDVLTGRRLVSARRATALPSPYGHGERYAFGGFETAPLILSLWMDGSSPDGSVDDWAQVLDLNISETLELIHTPHGVVDVSVTDGDGEYRTARCRVTGASPIQEESGSGMPLAKLSLTLELMDGMWLSDGPFSASRTGPGVLALTPGHQGGGAPLRNVLISITGPVMNPRVATHDGGFIQYTGSVASGASLALDPERMTATIGSASAFHSLTYGGGVGGLMDLLPPYSITYTGTSGASSVLTVSGRRAFF